jgi:hypothetical protein
MSFLNHTIMISKLGFFEINFSLTYTKYYSHYIPELLQFYSEDKIQLMITNGSNCYDKVSSSLINAKSNENHAILITLFHNIKSYSNIVKIFTKTIKNYYSRGKVNLDLQNPAAFIEETVKIMTNKYDIEEIRSNIIKVRMLEITVNCLQQLWDDLIKDINFGNIDEDLLKINVDITEETKQKYNNMSKQELKQSFKSKNNELYIIIINILKSIIITQEHFQPYWLFLNNHLSTYMSSPNEKTKFINEILKIESNKEGYISYLKSTNYTINEHISIISIQTKNRFMHILLLESIENTYIYNLIKNNNNNTSTSTSTSITTNTSTSITNNTSNNQPVDLD